MCTVRGGHGAARCPRDPRPYTGGFQRGAHYGLKEDYSGGDAAGERWRSEHAK